MAEAMTNEGTSSPAEFTVSHNAVSPVLPPCRICGQKASGFHYGVVTCEACKGFFRRSQTRKKKYKCAESENCEIGYGQGSGCSFCRFRKCLALGMSRKAIKTGRYTLERRTEMILEVKGTETKNPWTPKRYTQPILSHLPLQTKRPSRQDKLSIDFDEMINKIVEAHTKYDLAYAYSAEEAEEKQKRYLKDYHLKLKTFGPMSTLPKAQYEEIYQTTGLDVDNRQQMMKNIAGHMEAWIRRFVMFVKSIPGFPDLTSDDQANLVKCSQFEFRLLGGFLGYSNELKVWVSPKGGCFHLDEMSKVCESKFVHELFSFSETLKKLNLLPEEFVILKAMCVMFPDRCQLEERDKVEKIQWDLTQCLIYLLDKNHRDHPGLFASVIDKLTAMRVLTELNTEVLRSVKLWPAVQKNQLLVDFLSV